MQFVIDTIHVPDKYTNVPGMESTLTNDFQWVLSSLHSYKSGIGDLLSILHGSGANELSLEFKASSGRFGIIDWDTEIETTL